MSPLIALAGTLEEPEVQGAFGLLVLKLMDPDWGPSTFEKPQHLSLQAVHNDMEGIGVHFDEGVL